MKPPSEDATRRALALLVDSIQKETEVYFMSSCTQPLNTIPPRQLAANVDALSLARSHLNKEAAKLIACVQHQRNLAASIHQLPQEVFETILQEAASTYGLDRLLPLLQVGRQWYTTIINCPQFWTRLDSSYPARIAQLMLKRSKALSTLSFRWHWAHPRSNKEILNMAVTNSARFKSIEIQLRQEDWFNGIRRLLNSPSTVLESLRVEGDKHNLDSSRDGFGNFVLSEGAPLKHLDLYHVSANYDSPRFSGLITLRLHRSAIPISAPILVQVLSITNRLETLELSRATRIDPVRLDDWPPSSLISLPCLTWLAMDEIPRSYCAALLFSIHAPATRCHVKIDDVSCNDSVEEWDATLWQLGRSQMAALLGANDDSDPSRLIEITAKKCQVILRVDDHGCRGQRTFSFSRRDSWKLVNLIGEFLHHVPCSFDLDLSLEVPLARRSPLSLTLWGNHLVSLDISYPDASLSALEQLGLRTASIESSTGTRTATAEDWVCPSLLYIILIMPKDEAGQNTHISALVSLIQKRWSGDDGLAPARQPESFDIGCSRSSHAHWQEVEMEVQKTVPSFQFCGELGNLSEVCR